MVKRIYSKFPNIKIIGDFHNSGRQGCFSILSLGENKERKTVFYEKVTTTMKQVFDFLGLPEHQLPKYQKLNSGYDQPISKSFRQKLNEYFQPHNQRLEEYLGRQFNW